MRDLGQGAALDTASQRRCGRASPGEKAARSTCCACVLCQNTATHCPHECSAFHGGQRYLLCRDQWLSECSQLKQLLPGWAVADSALREGAVQLLGVLLGDEAALASATGHWLQALVALLLHRRPEQVGRQDPALANAPGLHTLVSLQEY